MLENLPFTVSHSSVNTVVRVTQQVNGKGKFLGVKLRNPWTDD